MSGSRLLAVAALPLILALSACETESTLPESLGFGANPQLPQARVQRVPTVRIAPAVGWPEGRTPVPAQGLAVNAFASGLDHPRWLYELPNGDVLVAETNAPPRPKGNGGGIRGWFERRIMGKAGARAPSADRITLLRDADGDGAAEMRTVLLEGLNSPFGMALIGDALFVANSDAVLRFPYAPGDTRIVAPGA